jgi:hypothetical protein
VEFLKKRDMTTVIVESNSAQATSFLEYARTLPFTTVVEERNQSFEEACAECNGVSVDEFFDELNERIKQYFQNA